MGSIYAQIAANAFCQGVPLEQGCLLWIRLWAAVCAYPPKLDAAAFWVLYAPIRHPPHRMQGSCCKMFHLQPPTPAALSAKAAKKDAPHTRPPFSPHQWDVSAVPVPHPIQSQGQRLCEYFSHHRNFGHGWLLDIQSAAASLLRTGGFRLSQIWLPAERLRRCKIFVPYSSYPHQYKCQTCFTPLRGWCFALAADNMKCIPLDHSAM